MVTLSAALHDEMIAHCRSRYPKEACGILAGFSRPSTAVGVPPARLLPLPGRPLQGVVAQVYPMTNVEDSPIGYSMDPKEQLQIEKQMRQRGQRMVGIFHSHTSSDAYPSSVDVSLAISPDISYVLVSLKDQAQPDVKSYRIEGTTITPEEIVRV